MKSPTVWQLTHEELKFFMGGECVCTVPYDQLKFLNLKIAQALVARPEKDPINKD